MPHTNPSDAADPDELIAAAAELADGDDLADAAFAAAIIMTYDTPPGMSQTEWADRCLWALTQTGAPPGQPGPRTDRNPTR